MKTPMRIRSWIAFALAALCVCAASRAGAAPPPERLLPQDALLVWSAPNCAALCNDLARSPLGRLLKDPAMQEFAGRIKNRIETAAVQPLERETGLRLEELAALFQGQASFAIAREGWTGGADSVPGVLIALDAGANKARAAALLGKFRKMIGEEKLAAARIAGEQFSVLSLTDPADRARGAPDIKLRFGQAGSVVLAGTAEAALSNAVAAIKGRAVSSLADSPAFQADAALMPRRPAAFFWVHLEPLFEALENSLAARAKENASAAPFAPDPRRILQAIGIPAVRSVFSAMAVEKSGARSVLFVRVPAKERKGLVNLPAAAGKGAMPPPFVPADALSFTRARLELSKLVGSAEATLNTIFPAASGFLIAQLDAGMKAIDEQADLRAGLLENLGDDLILFSKLPKEVSAEGLLSPPSLTLVGSPDPQRALRTLRALAFSAGLTPDSGAFEELEIEGRKAYRVRFPFAAASSGGEESGTLYLAAKGGRVGIAETRALLVQWLSGRAREPLRRSPDFRAAWDGLGVSEPAALGYQNEAAAVRYAVDALREHGNEWIRILASMLPAENAPKGGWAGAVGEWLDFSLLPPGKEAAKHFSVSVFGFSVKPEGYLLESYTPWPEGEDK